MECRAGGFYGVGGADYVLQPAVYRGDSVVRVDIEAGVREERDAVGTFAGVGGVEFGGFVSRGEDRTLFDLRV